jgi:TonB-dependent receptor
LNTPRPKNVLRCNAQGFRRTRLAAACGLLLAGATSGHAQPAAPATPAVEAAVQTLVVTGIRKSLESSLDLKRAGRGLVDGIVAEDIGKFPDSNLAESMQRISGVSIDRSIGEGSRITVRGVGPEFNLVLLNGRQMPASSIEATTASNSRAFDFANLASEAVSALEVYKTSRASTPTGGMGATINIRTARPLDTKATIANVGVKMVSDASNSRLPDAMKGDSITPEVSGIFSTASADGRFGVSITGSFQKRSLGYNQAQVPGGWRPFKGDETNWGTIPKPGESGFADITNRPKPGDVYSVPQNIAYSVNGVQRERTNGQLTLQFAPFKGLTATLDHTYSENKVQTKRNELSAWFNFGPSRSAWTDGPVSGPTFYSETIANADSDIAMAGSNFATRNKNQSTGLNVDWKVSDALRVELDFHKSTATSGSASPYGSNNSLGTASFNRGTTSVDFSQDFPVLSIAGSSIDASRMLVTGSSFRNSYMKSEIEQAQFRGSYKLDDLSGLEFGLSLTKANNRSAYANVDQGTWGGATSPADYPDSLWRADTVRPYFGRIGGSDSPALFNQFFTWDFEAVRAIAASVGNPANYLAPSVFTTDRRVEEKSQSAFLQYNRQWDWVVPIGAAFGVRFEKTDVHSSALVPTATGVVWGSNNEFSVTTGAPGFTNLSGSYNYVLPSIDLDADLTDDIKARLSYGETIGRPGWGAIQGGQTLVTLARLDGGSGEQGNPGLKPLKSKNVDFSLEFYYAKSSYAAFGAFQKNVSNYLGTAQIQGTPFNLRTPAGGALFNEAISAGRCVNSNLTCIRNYILNTYDGRNGVVKTGVDVNGNATGTITGQPNDPLLTFTINVPSNQRSDTIKGLEFNVQHVFGGSGFGVAANYTYVTSGLKFDNASFDEQFALPGLSNSANLVGFYEDQKLSVRVAYNWRDKFLTALFDGNGSGRQAPIYTEAYGQVDMSIGYKWNKNLSLQAEFINLNDGIQRLHGRTKEQVIGVTQTGRRYMLGARYQF